MTEQNESTPPLDEESLRLLSALEKGIDGEIADAKAEEKKAAPAKKKVAKKKATPKKKDALPVSDPKSPTGNPDPEPAQPAPAAACGRLPTITNVSKNHRRICRVDLAVGESYTLTAEDLEDERLMAKLTRAVELGVLESD